jgi:hypothetical protein
MIVLKIMSTFSGEGEKNEKNKLKKDTLFMALGRLEILIIRKDIRPNPNISITTTKIRIAETKKNFFLSPIRTILKDLNKSITVISS